ncbi:hypothetical protein NLU66_15320 [Brachybacterium sp. NBEC-018]|uniref:hypothetical protein n=1 Tax=Brachybacterium sp. NBEC-018 TaxID=2996004 RepID=UPI0021752A6A|nr:hypothetical protein [Brachybacterium sp. NBEC-018]UVY83570.1 hypothetical protein NLU66_15320 [Brachybacterium sp. NBEC-018]
MSGFYGADTEQLREQAGACLRGSGTLRDLIGTTSAMVGAVEWTGPDAEAFRERWQSEVRAQLTARADALRARADELTAQAEEQDGASDGDGSGGGGPFGSPLPFPFPLPGPGGPWENPGPFDRANLPKGPQEFYGDPGYGTRGQMYGQQRPVGEQFTWTDDLLPGQEISNGTGTLDAHAGVNYSVGASLTEDPYGNHTGTVGARGSLEAGVDTHLNGPFGTGIDASARVGAESYAEAGGTVGPDGYSFGAKAGSGLYASQSATVDGPLGTSGTLTQDYFVGANADASRYAHLTRNEDGQANGVTFGGGANAFAGGQVTQKFEQTGPFGWFSGSTSISEKAGAGAGASGGATISTDEVSVNVGGQLAVELGLGGTTSLAVHPNAIVNTFTPGDYDLDDAISDASGAFDGARDAVGSTVSAINPFD